MSDTAYVIDVAADMPGAGVTTAQLDELSQSLISAGASAESLEAATIAVGASLTAAREATKAANDALAEGNARYGELEKAAIKAAKAAESASLKGKLSPELVQTALDARAALDAETGSLKRLESEASAAAKAEAKLAATHGNLKKLSGSVAGSFSEQAAAAKKSIKEAEGFSPIVKQFNDLSDALSTSEGSMIVLTGAAVSAGAVFAGLTLAVIAGTIAIAAWGVGLADAKREAGITTEAVTALHPELANLSADFKAISDDTGASAEDMRAWKKQLDTAKVSAEDVPAALRAMAQAEAALGKGGSAEFLSDLKASKKAAGELADEYNSKLGGVVAKRMMGLDAQTAKLKKNIGSLFSGLNIDPVLEGMRVLVDLFDENTAAGESMKFLFETVFQPIIDQATNAAYVVEAFALGFLIGMTKLYIALKPAIKAVKEFFGFDDSTLTDTLDIAKTAGEFVAATFLAFIGVLAALGVAMAAAVGFLLLPVVALAALGVAVHEAAGAVSGVFVDAWNSVTTFLSSLSLVEIGTNIVTGLIDGILNMGPNVLKAITGIADGAIKAAKHALGIASPSKVFAEIGGFTAEGFAGGVDDGAGDAQDAMASMVEPPAPGQLSPYAALSGNAGGATSASSEAAARGGKSGGGNTINFNAPVYFGGTKATQAEVEDLAEAITKILEGDAMAIAGESEAA